jgi:hypothetical protein
MDERILRRIEQLVEAAESRFPSTLGEEWTSVGQRPPPPPPQRREERIEPEAVEERYTPRSRLERIEPETVEERYTARSRLERVEPEGERKREARPAPSPQIPGSPARTASGVRRLLGSRESLRQAILLQEILGPPKALREDRDPFGP